MNFIQYNFNAGNVNNDAKGRELIARLIEAMNCGLACCWDDFIGEQLAADVRAYMGWEEPEEEPEED